MAFNTKYFSATLGEDRLLQTINIAMPLHTGAVKDNLDNNMFADGRALGQLVSRLNCKQYIISVNASCLTYGQKRRAF